MGDFEPGKRANHSKIDLGNGKTARVQVGPCARRTGRCKRPRASERQGEKFGKSLKRDLGLAWHGGSSLACLARSARGATGPWDIQPWLVRARTVLIVTSSSVRSS